MKKIIHKVITTAAIAATAFGPQAFTQDALVNISTRGTVDPANPEASLIGGFSVGSEKRVILRAIGASLADQGVTNPITDARFDVYKLDLTDPANNENIGQNDNWRDGGQQLQIVASGLAPAGDTDSAMIMTLDAGVYTLNVATVSGEAGVALVEIFGLDAAGVGSTIGNTAGAGDNAEFTLLNAALAATGLDSVLDGEGGFTLFAPTDAAFLEAFTEAELDELLADDEDLQADLAALTEVLLYHVIPTTIPSSALVAGANTVDSLASTSRFTVTVSDSGVTAQNGNVIETDIPASNGVIHVVDAVLAPNGAGSELAVIGNTNVLSAAVAATGLTSILDGDGAFTIFAPADSAFAAAFTDEELAELLADDDDLAEDLEFLTGVLQYHVIPTTILAADIAEGTAGVPALTGLDLNVTKDGDSVTVQGANVIETDIIVGNGVIHIVDGILAPSGVGSTIASGGTAESFTILSAALVATGLDAALDGEGAFTLFAPNDDAFLAIFDEAELTEMLADDADQEQDLADLAAILSYHVVPSTILSTDLQEGVNAALALTGVNLFVTLDGSAVTVQGANVIDADQLASNGVIHSVNAVLSPSGIGSTIGSGGTEESFTILNAALEATGLDVALDGEGSFTLFAPNDAAFQAAFTQEQLDELLADDADQEQDLADLAAILAYHVAFDEIRSTDLQVGVNAADSLDNSVLFVTVAEGSVTVQGANVIEADLLAANGVIHVVDSVLSPSGVGSTVTLAAQVTPEVGEDTFTVLAAALQAAELVATLDDAEAAYTLFAPTDAAFVAAFTQEGLDELLADDADRAEDLATVTDLLLMHVVDQTILSTDLADGANPVDALNMDEIVVNVVDGAVTIESSTVIDPDVITSNGVIHIIDAVIGFDPAPGPYSYETDIEAYDAEAAALGDGWTSFGNVFDPQGAFVSNYGEPFATPISNEAFANVATGEGGAEQGSQYLNLFNNYQDSNHATANLVQALTFREFIIETKDAGVFELSFDAKIPNAFGITDPTTAFAFIKILNPADGFATTVEVQLDLTDTISDAWGRFSLELEVDGNALAGQILQFGFANTTTGYASSGVLYDNIAFGEIDD